MVSGGRRERRVWLGTAILGGLVGAGVGLWGYAVVFTAVVMKLSLGLVLIRGVRTAGYVGAEVFGGLNGFVLVELWIFSILGELTGGNNILGALSLCKNREGFYLVELLEGTSSPYSLFILE